MSQARKNSGSPNRGQAKDGTARAFDDPDGPLAYDLDVSEQAFREEERRICTEIREPMRRNLELESIRRLRGEMGDVLYDCRQVVLFQNWLDSPGREWLFKRYCSLAIAEWDSFVAKDQSPRVFRTGEETTARHLSHCSFCRMARRLAEGRLRMCEAGLDQLLRGDEIVNDCADHALADAFFQARAPRDLPAALTPGDGGEPTAIMILEQECERTNGQLRTLARLEGGEPDARVEVNVVWESTGQATATKAVKSDGTKRPDSAMGGGEALAERPSMPGCPPVPSGANDTRLADRLAFPNDKHPDSLIVVGADGSCLIPLVVPSMAAERGVVFKYCGCPVANEDARRLASLTPPNPTSQAIRTRGSMRGTRTRGPDPSGHGESANPPNALQNAVPVSVGAVSFQWARSPSF